MTPLPTLPPSPFFFPDQILRSSDHYTALGVPKSANDADIKKVSRSFLFLQWVKG